MPYEVIEGAMETPDRSWRVEAVHSGTSRWYRIIHGEDIIDLLTITMVKRILSEAGIDLGSLIEVGPAA